MPLLDVPDAFDCLDIHVLVVLPFIAMDAVPPDQVHRMDILGQGKVDRGRIVNDWHVKVRTCDLVDEHDGQVILVSKLLVKDEQLFHAIEANDDILADNPNILCFEHHEHPPFALHLKNSIVEHSQLYFQVVLLLLVIHKGIESPFGPLFRNLVHYDDLFECDHVAKYVSVALSEVAMLSEASVDLDFDEDGQNKDLHKPFGFVFANSVPCTQTIHHPMQPDHHNQFTD